MTQDTSNALSFVFRSLWDLLGSFNIPGTFLTGQHLLVAPLGAIVLITVLRKVLDIGGASISSSIRIGRGSSYHPDNGKGKDS